jgi:hypothetical protein
MRFIATTLATVSAAFIINDAAPKLSGMPVLPPCEIAPQVASPPPPLLPPTNVRITSKIGLTTASVSGSEATTAATAGDPHAYYFDLASRSDCFAAYGLRNAAQVAQYRTRNDLPPDITYTYPSDPDRRRQDAAKILIPAGEAGIRTQLHLPIGPHHPKNILVTFDVWWGAEYAYGSSNLAVHKGTPIVFGSPGDRNYLGMRANYVAATQSVSNLPPGGPFVAFPYAQGIVNQAIKDPFFIDGDSGYPRLRLPYGGATTRPYVEGIAPVDTSVIPGGAEFGVKAETWTRYWHFFERASSLDWFDATFLGGKTFPAYKWSMWAADANRGPMRILNEVIASVHPDSPGGLGELRVEFLSGGGIVDAIPPGRGPLVAYTRNFVVLHGTSKAAAVAILQKPAQ